MLYVDKPVYRQINRSNIEQVLKIDGIDCTESNVFATEVLLNTWLPQIVDYNPVLAPIFWDYVKLKGLKETIQACSTLADEFIRIADQGWLWGKNAEFAIQTLAVFGEYTDVLMHSIMYDYDNNCITRTREGFKHCLQILRYAKRFTWPDNDQLKRESIRKFIDLNHAHGARDLKCRTSFYYEFSKRIQEKMDSIFKGFTLHDMRESCFTSGASADSAPVLAGKLLAMSKHEGAYRGWIPWSKFNVPYTHRCEVVAVPKNYKTARIIAKEQAGNTFHAKAVQNAMRRCFKRNKVAIYYDDQEINREGARLGALRGKLATIDHSAASDSIPYSLAFAVTPVKVRQAIINCRSNYMHVFKNAHSWKLYPVFIWLTSGHPCTWDYESAFFLSAADSVRDIYIELTGDRDVEKSRVFGDDLEIDTKIFELYSDIMEYMDFTVNREKSFKGDYRESCGVEYLLELETSTQYFPRKPLTFVSGTSNRDKRRLAKFENCESFASIISLQHNLYTICPDACRYLELLILDHIPDMTYHVPGTDCADLWGHAIPKLVPYKKGISRADCPEAGLRELHYIVTSIPAYPDVSSKLFTELFGNNYLRDDLTGSLLEVYSYTEFLLNGSPELDAPSFRWINGRRYGLPENRQVSASDKFGSKACWVLRTE